jgi:flagellin-like hook-associated protein FlgL
MRIGLSLFGVDSVAQRGLWRAFQQLQDSSIRLSTMRRIHRGADDPAGLISAETLASELAALEAANRNTSRATGVVHVADAALGQTSELLREIKAKVVEVAGGGLSDSEVDATQIEIDAALDALDMIGNTTAYGGQKLLDGSKDPTASGEAMAFAFSVDPAETVTLPMPTISTSSLGGDAGSLADLASGGAANVKTGDLEKAMAILDDAEGQVLTARAEIGAFEEYTIGASQRLLDAMEENFSQGLSLLRDTDVAAATSQYVRAQILTQCAATTLNLAGQRRSLIGSLFAW